LPVTNDKRDLEAALAHDLNNTLQVVMGNLEVLRRRGTYVPEIVNAALNATRNAAHLADRLVSVGRLKSLAPRPIELNDALGDFADMIERTAGDSVRVNLERAAAPARVAIDPRCLQIALLELVTNARDAMPGGGQLTVRLGAAGAGLVKIEVLDTGVGMTAEQIGCAFEPVFSGGDSTKPVRLGLHIVERCIGASGGRVEISSRPSRGTTIALYLPCVNYEERL
jgi:signal transduction histidine kinase